MREAESSLVANNLLIALAGRMRFCFSFSDSSTEHFFGRGLLYHFNRTFSSSLAFNPILGYYILREAVLRACSDGMKDLLCSRDSYEGDWPANCKVFQGSCWPMIAPSPVTSPKFRYRFGFEEVWCKLAKSPSQYKGMS